jgi:hypothetical protein
MRKIRHEVSLNTLEIYDPSYRFKTKQVCLYCKYFSPSKRYWDKERCVLHPSYTFHGIDGNLYVCPDWRASIDDLDLDLTLNRGEKSENRKLG